MSHFSEFYRGAGFKKWLDVHLPSCNDNDDPDRDNAVHIDNPDVNRRQLLRCSSDKQFSYDHVSGGGQVTIP